jgi:hypothetical protein
MHPTREICKAYYVADVKGILPPNCELGVEKRPICLIIGLSVLAVIFPARREPGGSYAHACTVRSQMRKSASARYPEPTSRAGQRCTVSDEPLFRSPRSTPGQIRDAASSGHRWPAHWNHCHCLWVLAHHAISTPQAFRGGWVGWPTSPTQRASSSSQTVRRNPDLYPANAERRARTAHCKPAVAGEPTLWDIHPSTQYPTRASQAAKKRLPDHETSQPLCPATPQSESECLARYEILRRQVLKSGDDPHPISLELAFIQRQGLAAWVEYGPDCLPGGAVSVDLQTPEPGEAETPSHNLVLALADLVLGDRQEAQDGRSD